MEQLHYTASQILALGQRWGTISCWLILVLFGIKDELPTCLRALPQVLD